MRSPSLDRAVVQELDRLLVERERGAITEEEHRRRVDELIRDRQRRWRGITVAMVIWTLVFALALLSGAVSLVANPCTGPASVCYGALLGAMMLGMVWLIGSAVLGAIWLATRPNRHRTALNPLNADAVEQLDQLRVLRESGALSAEEHRRRVDAVLEGITRR